MGVQLLWILMRCIQIECSVQAFLVVLLVLAGGRRLISTRYFPFWGILDIKMAEKPPQPSGKALAGFNFVANDQVWKDHIRYEETASKRWPEYWGFLGGNYRDLVKDDFVKREVKKIELPPPLVLPPITPISRYIKVDPSPKPFPQTTAGKIGWRSSERQHSLEIYGSYARPKGGLINQLNWPPEGVL